MATKDHPTFGGMSMRKFDKLEPGFFFVVQVTSDGKDFAIDWAEHLVPHITKEVLEKMKFVLEDSFYRIRPDLRST